MTTGLTSLLKLSMVGQRKAVPESDGVREEGSLVDLGSGIRYKVVESMASNRADWYEVSGWHVN